MTLMTTARARRALALVALLLAGFLYGCASQSGDAEDSYDLDAAREEIWGKEQAIYAARGDGDLQTYINNTSEHYMGWPPGWDQPSGLEKLREGAKGFIQYKEEELTMTFGDITFSGDTAVIYYSTHRTRMPTGEAVDQRFEIIHVWTREEGEWRLVGALGRTKPPEA
ncbi:MAG: nuclear transport factor 2 family protein [Pseudomonadota bacterium]